MSSQQVVFPGDAIATAEEFLPGAGTYEENGEVFAARIGVLDLDTSEFVARVKGFPQELAVLRPGDVVIGTVQAMRASMAIVEVRALATMPDRAVGGDTNGTLAIRNIADHYVDRIEDCWRLGDIVRAEVVSVSPSIQLSTKGGKFGLLKGYCPRCRTTMERKGDGLACPECDWKETAKFAADYGEGLLVYEGPEPEAERRTLPRRDREGGGGFRGGGGGRGGPRGDRRGGGGGGFRGGGRGEGGGRGGPRGDRGGDRRGGGGGGGARREGGGGPRAESAEGGDRKRRRGRRGGRGRKRGDGGGD